MKNREEKLSYLRKKDFISIFITTVISAFIFLFINEYFVGTTEAIIFSYIGVIGGIITVIVSYFESKSNDPFVTGKTLTFGVINSFIGAGVVILLTSFRFGLIPSLIVIDIIIIMSRELGRKSREKMLDKFINKTGTIIKNNGNGKYVMDLNSKRVTVYSKDNLAIGGMVKVSELKGTCIYVEVFA